MPDIRKVLIANRGEIAVRVIRACRDLGIATVAVFSEIDEVAEHVVMADQAVPLGGRSAADSYLRADKLLAAVAATGADAVHPGYGFLSENAEFAGALERAGVTLIGPPAAVMATMGDKVAARQAAERAGLPVIPGTSMQDGEEAVAAGQRALAAVGLPLLIKAAFGGGGKGMRVVREAAELAGAISEATREAKSAFGDGTVYFERFLARPRHVEIQVFSDGHGHSLHLGERECSVQRRHQKLIEETPSTAVGPELRARMGKAAAELARSVGYRGAGTVEFLLDEDGSFYFMEMNTRLQVEHTVTELVTGVDLVKEQIRVARGEPLSFSETPVPRGHAIQCRISAEDPASDFAPSTGRVLVHRPPRGPHVRVDDGLGDAGEISLYYDPMFAKLSVWGATREEALDRMQSALREYIVVGVHTTIPFHLAMIADQELRAGRTDITFVERRWPGALAATQSVDAELAQVLAAALELRDAERSLPAPVADRDRWRQAGRQQAQAGREV